MYIVRSIDNLIPEEKRIQCWNFQNVFKLFKRVSACHIGSSLRLLCYLKQNLWRHFLFRSRGDRICTILSQENTVSQHSG